MDMPKNCGKCYFRMYHDSKFCFTCRLARGFEIQEEELGERKKWCPLREVPQKKEDNLSIHIPYNEGYLNGWNDCIKEMLGEKES